MDYSSAFPNRHHNHDQIKNAWHDEVGRKLAKGSEQEKKTASRDRMYT